MQRPCYRQAWIQHRKVEPHRRHAMHALREQGYYGKWQAEALQAQEDSFILVLASQVVRMRLLIRYSGVQEEVTEVEYR